MFRNLTPLFLFFAILIGIILYAVGCGYHENPLSGDVSNNNGPSTDGISVITKEGDRSGAGLMGGNNKAFEIIDSDGGSVEFDWVSVAVPPGAITGSRSVRVCITIQDPYLYVLELDPHNYTFSEDVTITIDVSEADLGGIDIGTVQFYRYEGNGPNGEWILIGGTYDEDDETISVDTRGFSYWALASD